MLVSLTHVCHLAINTTTDTLDLEHNSMTSCAYDAHLRIAASAWMPNYYLVARPRSAIPTDNPSPAHLCDYRKDYLYDGAVGRAILLNFAADLAG